MALIPGQFRTVKRDIAKGFFLGESIKFHSFNETFSSAGTN